jgi:hypothetical protein
VPQSIYTQADVDQIVAELAAVDSALDARLKALEGTTPVPIPVPDPPPVPVVGQFYAASSSWNTKLKSPTFADVAGLHQGGWWINAGAYGVPVVHTDSSSPVVTVNAPGSWGWPATKLSFHLPASAAGATGTDGSIVIIDGGTSYDFWQFNRNGNTANPAAWAKADLVNGSGWGQASPFLAAGIHATGSALLAGLIVPGELKTGINHALAVAVRRDLAGGPTGEAINSDGSNGPIKEGARLAIPATTPVTVTSTPGKMVWRAMVDYGAFVIDVADGTQAGYLWADPAVDSADIQVLLDPNWTAAELAKVATAVRLVN